MSVSYDYFAGAFLSKISEYDFLQIPEFNRNVMVDGYMKRAISEFRFICKYDFAHNYDDVVREFKIDVPDADLDEIANIVSEGMVAQWLKPYVYAQENLVRVLNTRDFTGHSPAELLLRVREVQASAQRGFTAMMREYSFNHGDLTSLHI